MRTTDSNHGELVIANVLNQDFSCDRADQKWGAEISYIWTSEGWLYLAQKIKLAGSPLIKGKSNVDLPCCDEAPNIAICLLA